ncbi:MAG: MFS transporter [Flavipsychrobacter sp.]|nr:MFS transporter [Flavipsychrobacter sp.]
MEEATIAEDVADATPASKQSLFPILLVNFIGTLGFSVVLPFLVVIVLKLGGNEIVYGILGATYSFFQFIGAPILGSWSDKFGRKKILILSSAGTLAGWIIFLFALILPIPKVSYPFLGGLFIINIPLIIIFLARALDGITGGNISVANAYLADISTHKERKRNFGKMSASANLGLIFGPVLAGVLGATIWGNLLPVAAAAFISLISIVVIAIKLKNVVPGTVTEVLATDIVNRIPAQSQKECYLVKDSASPQKVSVFTLPDVNYFLVLYFLIFLAFNFFYVAFPVFVAQQLHWSVLQIGIFFSVLSGLLVLVQGPVLTILSNKFSSSVLVIAGCLLLAVGFALFMSSRDVIIYAGAFFFALGNGLMWPSFQAILSNIVADKYQGVVQGYASSAGSLASIIGLLSGAFLYKSMGVNIFLIATVLMVLIAISSYHMIVIEQKNNE